MRLLAAFLLPLLAAAQATLPPPEVEQALRERATQFLQYQVDGNFRKSFDLVAEDTKDSYFAAAKGKLNSFKIEAIEYAENFTKATVKGATKRTFQAMGHSFDVDVPIVDHWKLEDGKWFWYQNTTVMNTPLGALPVPSEGTAMPSAPGAGALPTDMSPEAAMAAARKLMSSTTVNKKNLEFVAGKAASDEIVFHNGAPGIIKLVVDKQTAMDSITLDVTEVYVKPGQDSTVKVHYTPDASGVKATTIRLTVEPFEKIYPIPVTLIAQPK